MWTFSSEFWTSCSYIEYVYIGFVYSKININVAGLITKDMGSLVVQILNYLEIL